MSTFEQKVVISIFSAVLFIIVSLPKTYQLTNSSINGCPTDSGILIHTLVFFILAYLSMWRSTASVGFKIKFSIYGTLLYYLISSPALYSLTGSIFGPNIATNGCPTTLGVILHSIVYCAALIGLMYLPGN